MEIPIGFTNIRTGSNDTLTLVVWGVPYYVKLTDKDYTTIDSLVTDINAAITALGISYTTITLSVANTLTHQLTFTLGTPSVPFTIVDTNLSKYNLGFRADQCSVVGSSYTAPYSYNLNIDHYLTLYIPELNSLNASMSGQRSTFKLPCASVWSNILYWNEQDFFKQWVDITDSSLTLSQLTVRILDRFGNDPNPRGLDYSMTISVEIWD